MTQVPDLTLMPHLETLRTQDLCHLGCTLLDMWLPKPWSGSTGPEALNPGSEFEEAQSVRAVWSEATSGW